jgi:transposase
MKGEAQGEEKEQAMKSQKHPEQSAVENPAAREATCPEANAQATAVDPPGSEAASAAVAEPDRTAPPRLSVPDRQQLLSSLTIDDLLEANHPARAVWSYVEALDLTPWYDRIRARGSVAGRPAIDPRLLVALWLYATLTGFSSAREIADLCSRHDAFRWLCGGLSVNYHTLADFRTDNPEFLEPLLKQSVEVLRQQGLLDLDRVAQDGMRVRASAGAASFRRRETLERLLREAEAEIQRLQQKMAATAAHPTGKQEVATEQVSVGEQPSRQQQAAAMRHAEERLERIEQALERMPEMEAKIKPDEDKEARVSTTDPQATVMKMADGGYRPAYNIEYATACQCQAIVGVEVIMVGSDQGQLPPMLDQIEARFEQRPKEALVDGRVASHKDIEEVQGGQKKCKVYAPVAKPKKEGVDRHEPKATDSEEVAEWRKRMGTPEAKKIYKERGATAECVNAQARNRGLQQFTVRGAEKVKAIALWFAIVQNMARCFALLPQLE